MNKVIDIAVGVLDWLVVLILYIRDGLRPKPVVFVHQGGEALLPELDVLKVQPALLAHFKNEKSALILQKFHEWLEVNRKKGSHQYDGHTWTYGSYLDWHKRHFDWFSIRHFGTLIGRLVDNGFLISTEDAPFCKKGEKAYRVNYDKINALLGYNNVREGTEQTSTPYGTNFGRVQNKVRDNNSSKTSFSKQSVKQTTTTTTARAPDSDFLKSLGGAFAVAVENQESDSGEFFTDQVEAITDTQADLESVEVIVETPPDSASPPSPEEKAWQVACEQLGQDWDSLQSETLLHRAEFLSVENGVFIIGVPNSYICDFLQYRINDEVQAALSKAMGVDDVKIEYRVHRPQPDPAVINQEMPLFRLMAGAEVDTDTDGTVALTDEEYFIQRLMADFPGLDTETVTELMGYGQKAVEEVAQFVKKAKNLRNPEGLLIAKLRKLGLGETRHQNKWERWAKR